MGRGIVSIIIGIGMIVGGLSGGLVLRGTNSSGGLAVVGGIVMVIGIVRIVRANNGPQG